MGGTGDTWIISSYQHFQVKTNFLFAFALLQQFRDYFLKVQLNIIMIQVGHFFALARNREFQSSIMRMTLFNRFFQEESRVWRWTLSC